MLTVEIFCETVNVPTHSSAMKPYSQGQTQEFCDEYFTAIILKLIYRRVYRSHVVCACLCDPSE